MAKGASFSRKDLQNTNMGNMLNQQQSLIPDYRPKTGILAIRELSNKDKDAARIQLAKQAANFIDQNSYNFIYIPGNVSSSKNSKEIGRFQKRNDQGILEDFYTLVNSDVTKKYIKASKKHWLDNLPKFKKITEGLDYPFHIEFTFIRDSLRAFDFINACQLPADLMKDYGYYPDDETCYLVPLFNPTVYYSNTQPGLIMRVIGGKDLLPF